ncbi:hypothetical protein PHYBLDRAFT_145972 [Phycomyces blakesleeanus NRRL 1555(-)]|uniref:Uncharacterized protein n=1 Tax=Phycomyces blakesleeanus (strain ATCC 8743b / DSM 1359 / FGSC 10004 / NBRC 33097 / NRRL 1555) TaxID=763407 RepID=A0A162X5Q3_PHYB8|nr:hypothetical protein PHYBLDRAFT_145972 [Phycomyces blakesleeanus NRRL 1555(-)]OAD72655.1 hypothetical protein PHYBLDRAFT_145972 [Phycomyces blakesleeanus NRRL 1555(-)]|eukprot:XP_018290695.1 hypothetical protein PHYBLDRAFT_145972 [Phycomyces blakesleeanus NRRL 1555(-)]
MSNDFIVDVVNEISHPCDGLHLHHFNLTGCVREQQDHWLKHACLQIKIGLCIPHRPSTSLWCKPLHSTLICYNSQRLSGWVQPKLGASNIITCSFEVAGSPVCWSSMGGPTTKAMFDPGLMEQDVFHIFPWFLPRPNCCPVFTNGAFNQVAALCPQWAHLSHHVAKMSQHVLVYHKNCGL